MSQRQLVPGSGEGQAPEASYDASDYWEREGVSNQDRSLPGVLSMMLRLPVIGDAGGMFSIGLWTYP